ncbi:LLM class flavin-dependent oxidoreductase [Streptomyces noursei]|nr:LLM class flavin-dependent oxidoreductase [Streptomyces noursei]
MSAGTTAPTTVLRVNLAGPPAAPADLSARYRAAVEMARYADEHGLGMIQTEEHHATDNGWMPSPLAFAGAVLGATRRIGVTVSALITPLHDPLRLAEDIAVLDLLGGGRLVTVAGLGYRPEEYAAHGKEWRDRGALQDEVLQTLLNAWTGEPFTYQGRTVQVTPRPYSRPHPPLLVGAPRGPRPGARPAWDCRSSQRPPAGAGALLPRAARRRRHRGLGAPTAAAHLSAAHLRGSGPELGRARRPPAVRGTAVRGVAVRRSRSAVRSAARDAAALRAEGVYRIVTPDDCVELAQQDGARGTLILHPLCGGMPVEEGWRSLRLFAEKVLPRLTD